MGVFFALCDEMSPGGESPYLPPMQRKFSARRSFWIRPHLRGVGLLGRNPIRFFASAFVWILTLPLVVTTDSVAGPWERTEEREPCADHDPLRRPFFGDLHVHTAYSFDSYISSQRNEPADAYRYAKGEAILLPDEDGRQTVEARIQRPLDFTAVTDHSEYLGQIDVCTRDPWRVGYWWPHCVMTRADHYWTQLLAANWWTKLGGILTEEV